MGKQKSWLLAILLVTIVVFAACSDDSEGAANKKEQTEDKDEVTATGLKVMESENVGKYLADTEGKTLYIFTEDKKGVSNCTGKCLSNWPAFHTKDFKVPEGYNKSDFGTITRKDTDEKQTTYKGYPLYYFVKDKEKGDVKGQGVKDVWYVANNQTFKKHIDQAASLTEGIDKVLTSLQDLKDTVQAAPNDAKKTNNKGKALSESWEPIEKTVEKRNTEAYENIEKSLYPLIAEAKRDHPDIDKMQRLIEETTSKLKMFKKKLASSS
ncbi:COG4315 family predicted lipoprotein [Halobacillus shinanisalinarum]|uniref:COG4315 family predicted lipoprotein n=1 Tax=Halobacillus shinanisalinarum TaxID=2932258 RepID=UPI0029623610|nr:hypothetical protein [Halobacillus shinanisalinarum]